MYYTDIRVQGVLHTLNVYKKKQWTARCVYTASLYMFNKYSHSEFLPAACEHMTRKTPQNPST